MEIKGNTAGRGWTRGNSRSQQRETIVVKPAQFTGFGNIEISEGKILVFANTNECTLVELVGKIGEADVAIAEIGRKNRHGPSARLDVMSTFATLKQMGLALAVGVMKTSQNGEDYTSQKFYRSA